MTIYEENFILKSNLFYHEVHGGPNDQRTILFKNGRHLYAFGSDAALIGQVFATKPAIIKIDNEWIRVFKFSFGTMPPYKRYIMKKRIYGLGRLIFIEQGRREKVIG